MTTMSTPSSASRRRSRSATSWTSPTREAVDERDSGLDLVDDPRAAARELDDRRRSRRSGCARRGTPASRASFACAASIRYSPWIGITWRGRSEREHRPQLLLARVAGDVHRRDLLVQHLGARARELVDRVVDAQLVPGHRLRGDDHGVAAARPMTALWSPYAMRVSADIGSPWLPVQRIEHSLGRQLRRPRRG